MSLQPETLIGSLITAVLSGGGTAFTTVFALFKDLRKKVEELEKKVGSFESKTGLAYATVKNEEAIKDLKRDTEETTEGRRRRPSFLSLEDMMEADASIPAALVQKFRHFDAKLRELEDIVQRLDMKMKRAVSEEEFESADRKRAEEISGVRATVFEVKGLLQGLHMALGLTKR
jgi:predicted RNase H-like nuclease (RuvC/YqgF family)